MDPLGGGPRAAYAHRGLDQRIQILLDKSVPHIGPRWFAFAVVVLVYLLRVFFLEGFYIVTYGIGIFNLNLLIGFLSPQVDPDQEGPMLPTTARSARFDSRRASGNASVARGARCVGCLSLFTSAVHASRASVPEMKRNRTNEATPSSLSASQDGEFRPFVRRLPEFKFWCAPSAEIASFCRLLSFYSLYAHALISMSRAACRERALLHFLFLCV